MYTLKFCDYDEEKQQQQQQQQQKNATGFLPRHALYEGIPRNYLSTRQKTMHGWTIFELLRTSL